MVFLGIENACFLLLNDVYFSSNRQKDSVLLCLNLHLMRYRDLHSRPLTVLAALASLVFLAGVGPALGAGWQVLPGHVPAATKKLQPIGKLAATNELHLAIGLPSRDQPGLDAFLQALQDPASPSYHQYLTPDQFTQRFGPTEADYQAVVDYAAANHLTVVQKYHNRLVLSVAGQAADIEKALQVKMLTYQHPTEARLFYAPDGEPSVALSPRLAHISGLDNFTRPHPKHHRSASHQAKATPHGSGPGGQIWGNDYRDAYVAGTTLTGAGQSMGLLEFETYYASDLTNYVTTALKLPASRTPAVQIVAIAGSASQNESGDNGEECTLDLEVSFAMAPGVTNIVLFAGGANAAFDEIFATMVEPAYTNILQFSCSWGGDTTADPTSETLFQQMQAQGQSFYNASGDNGAFAQGAATLPSDSPNITQVGGSSLSVGASPRYAWVSESAWDDSSGAAVAAVDCVASSGGFSAYYPIPYWQTNVNYLNSTGTNQASMNWRNYPDVSANGEENNEIIADQGQSESGWGGTSFAAPQWCGFTALLNQQQKLLNAGAAKPVGFLNPALYALAQQPNAYTTYFHDVIGGNNLNSSSPTSFYCTAGYDLVCGIGTPMGTKLINALTAPPDPLVITPVAGFTASGFVGGPFSGIPQILSLTNAGAKALSWSLMSTSTWLSVSVWSGTLAAGTQTNLTATLTEVAARLTVGTYATTVLFSNQSSQVLQARQFALQVLSSLAVSATNGFVASGQVGGSFNLTAQSFTVSNLNAAALDWGILNTSVWLTASPAAGSLVGGTAATCTVALAEAAYTLPTGVYHASVQVTNQGAVTASLLFSLQVGQSVVQNGGFETGDFTDWKLVGDTIQNGFYGGYDVYDAVTNSSFLSSAGVGYVHSGTYGAVLGEAGQVATLSQSVATVPGQSYLLSLWLIDPTSLTTQIFDVNWSTDGSTFNTLYALTNLSAFSWTNLTYVVTATSTSSTLQFAAENDQDYFGLDDVSLTPIPKPSFAALDRGPNRLGFTWYSLPGLAYVIQYKTNLLQAHWINLSTNTAASSSASFTITTGTDPLRFYRIGQLP